MTFPLVIATLFVLAVIVAVARQQSSEGNRQEPIGLGLRGKQGRAAQR